MGLYIVKEEIENYSVIVIAAMVWISMTERVQLVWLSTFQKVLLLGIHKKQRTVVLSSCEVEFMAAT